MRKKFVKGSLYKIRFYDHCIGGLNKMICEAVGWCILDDKDHVVLTSWVVDTSDSQVKKDNVEPISIIKCAIIRTRKIS